MDASFGFCKSDKNVPISHLDYKYIENCKNAKEIEKLLKILRSGEEGIYPDLIKFTEKRLRHLNPKSMMLLEDNPLRSVKDIGGDEGYNLVEDLNSWSEQMVEMEENMKKAKTITNNDVDYPPIRIAPTKKETESNQAEEVEEKKSTKRVAPRTYGEWEKVDVEEEIKKVDESKITENTHENKSIPSGIISNKDIPEEERPNRANLEKEKGNEAFKAGDYDESIIYYNRSLSINPVISVYNNRAIAFIKINKFEDAIKDCNTVLKEESDNIKALLRRGIAMKSMKRYENAREDFKTVLKFAPDNKRAKVLFEELSKLLSDSSVNAKSDNVNDVNNMSESEAISESKNQEQENKLKKGKRLIIEEVENSEKLTEEIKNTEKSHEILGNQNLVEEEVKSKEEKSKGKRLKIVEVDDTADAEGVVETKGKTEKIGAEDNNLQDENRSVTNSVNREGEGKEDKQHEQNISSVTSETQVTNSLNEDISSRVSDQEKINKKQIKTKMKNKNTSVVLTPPISTPPKPLPENVVILKDKGNSFYKIGRYTDAVKCYTDAINQLTKDALNHASSIAVLLSNRSSCKLKIGDCKGCIDDANESLKLMPSAKALLRRAHAYESLEKYRNAYVDYQAALRMDANASAAWQASTRLTKVLKDLDGPKWREKLPKTEVFQNQVTSSSQNVSSFEQKMPSNIELKEANNATTTLEAKGYSKEYIDSKSDKIKKSESREEQFKRIKENGNRYVQQGKYEEAANCYTQCMELIPDEVVSYTNRAMCYLKLNKPNKADADCTRALGLQQNNIKALYRRALARKTGVRYKDALQDLNLILKLDSKNAAAKKELEVIENLYKNQTSEKERKEPEMKPTFKVPDKNVKVGNVKGKKVRIEEINNDEEEKEIKIEDLKSEPKKKGKKLKIIEVDEYEEIDKGYKNKEKGIKEVEDSKKVGSLIDEKSTAEEDSRKSETKKVLSNITKDSSDESQHEKSSVINEASSELKEVSSLTNQESLTLAADLTLPHDVVHFKDEGNSLYKCGRYADAIKCYTAAINAIQKDALSHSSSIAVLLSNRSSCKLKIGDCKGCIDDANESLKLMPSAKALLRRAHAYESLERYRNAYVDYQTALRIDSSLKSAWDASTRLAKVLKDLDGLKWRDKLPRVDSFSNIVQEKEQFSQKATQNEEIRTENIKINDKCRHETTKEDKGAESRTEVTAGRIIKSENKKEEPKRSETKDEKFKRIKDSGNKFVQQEKYQEASNCYSQCIDLLPDEVASYTNRALCYLRLNKPKKAVSDCSKALAIQPGNIKALFRNALAKKAIAKYMEALQDLSALLKIEPQNAAANKELEIIKGLWREELKNTQIKSTENKKPKETKTENNQKSGKNKNANTDDVLKNHETLGQKDASLGASSVKNMASGVKKSTKEPTQKSQPKKISGFEFLQAWNELKGRSLKEHAELLAQVEPTQLPKILSNKIDGDMIQTIVSCVQEFFLTKDKLLLGFNILRHMSKSERFNMAVMFLSTNDLSKIKRVVEEIESKLKDTNSGITTKEMNDLKRAYKVTS